MQLDFVNYQTFRDLLILAPEAALVLTMTLLLFLRLFPTFDRWHLGYLSLIACLMALLISSLQWLSFPLGSAAESRELFSGLLVFDGLSAFTRMLILGATSLCILLTVLSKVPDREDSADFHVLLLGGTLGMCLMASTQHFLMVYISLEMASVPSYVLAGFLKGRKQGSEAALKYVVYGGASTGLLLYGISLLCGRLGTGYLPDVCISLQTLMATGGMDTLNWLALSLVFLGLSFKLSLIPMHFWCPDVFEGAAAEVGAFLSVVSKLAALSLLGRLILLLMGGTLPGQTIANNLSWAVIAPGLSWFLVVIAAATCTWGNLAAYPQTQLKRFWAYSTIAHAGYLIMPLACLTREGLAAALTYAIPYLFMNIGVFAIVCFVRNATHREDMAVLSGLLRRSPMLAFSLTVLVIGLIGLPPLAGFVGKYEVFASLFTHGQQKYRIELWILLGIGVLNTLLALGYYGKLLKLALFDQPADPAPLSISFRQQLFVLILALFVLFGMFFWDVITLWGSQSAVSDFK
jgi:NADH-quinone oxidoreductase subunit N